MRRFPWVLALLPPVAVVSQEAAWMPMSGKDIRAALSGRTLHYETARQTFHPSGRTIYDAGHPSWGYWRIEADRYCSQWPPNDLWTCYGVDRRGGMLRFVGPSGEITEAVYPD